MMELNLDILELSMRGLPMAVGESLDECMAVGPRCGDMRTTSTVCLS